MRADAARNRAKVLDAAAAVFEVHGPDASMEEIAQRAQVGIGTLYRHFPDRQSLMLALYRERLEALTELGVRLLASPEAYDALREWLGHQLILNRTHQAVAAAAMIAMLDDPDGQPMSCEAMKDVGDRLLQRAIDAGEVRDDVTVEDLARMVSAIALASDRAPEGGCVCGDRLFGVMMDGLRAHQSADRS
jgi:AcrR family transcriptional regulator